MPDSRTEQILDAIVAALSGPGKPAGLIIERSRRKAFEPGNLPHGAVYPLREDPALPREGRTIKILDRRLRFLIRWRVRGDDSALDPLRQWALTALHGSVTLGALLIDLQEMETEWNADDASDADYSTADMVFIARYTTARADLTQAA